MPSRVWGHGLGRGPTAEQIQAGATGGKWVNAGVPAGLPAGFKAIGRFVRQGDILNQWYPQVSPQQATQNYYSEQSHYIDTLPRGTYVENQNEPNLTPQNAQWFWDHSLAWLKLMESMGLKGCIGNFAKGNPARPIANDNGTNGLAIWQPAVPVLRYAKANGHMLGWHAYGQVRGVSDPNWWEYPYIFYRFAEVYAWLPAEARVDLVINEWGLDDPLGQFRAEAWRNSLGGADPNVVYFNMIRDYDWLVRQRYPYLKGFTIYTEGINSDPAWKDFDIEGTPLVPMLTRYIQEQRNVQDDSGGGGDMGKFSAGQTVFVISSPDASVKNLNDQTLGRQPINSEGRITESPGQPASAQVGNDLKWNVNFNSGPDGYVTEANLGTSKVDLSPEYQNRRIRARVKPHGTPHAVLTTPNGAQVGSLQESSAFELITEYGWYDGEWWLKADGSSRIPKGWLRYKVGNDAEHDSLEIYSNGEIDGVKMDGKPFPDFEKPWPGVWPPVSQPPVEPPPPPPPPEPPPIGEDAVLSFEAGHTAVTGSIQKPNGWEMTYRRPGETGFIPQKLQGGRLIPAIVERDPEVRLLRRQDIPPTEHPGQSGAIMLDGDHCLKIQGGSYSIQFAKVIEAEPGDLIRVQVPALLETKDKSTVPSGLEPDHWVATLVLTVDGESDDDAVDYRIYDNMRGVHEIPGLTRDWNLFEVEAVAGETNILYYTQQANWLPNPHGVDGFLDRIIVEVIPSGEEPPEEPPPGELPDIEPELERLESVADMLEAQAEIIRGQIAVLRSKADG